MVFSFPFYRFFPIWKSIYNEGIIHSFIAYTSSWNFDFQLVITVIYATYVISTPGIYNIQAK